MDRFHYAFGVSNLDQTRNFYQDILGCAIGRSSEKWIDFDFRGHQITAHLAQKQTVNHNPVDGDQVPIPHFGVILPWPDWQALADRLKALNVSFVIEPRIRFQGQAGEQGTFFIRDPSGNHLEFKTFQSETTIFERGA
ncbi:MAG: VOC family protein [Acidobacteria bacterium]|nr:VOC family protein [Acidobacteriota bacterium]